MRFLFRWLVRLLLILGTILVLLVAPVGYVEIACQKPASAGKCTSVSWVRSMSRASGLRDSMTPFMVATKGPLWPKSVVRVMTPQGSNSIVTAAA